MITHRASESVYTVPLSAVNGLSRDEQWARTTVESAHHFRIESNLNNRFEFEWNLEALQVRTL